MNTASPRTPFKGVFAFTSWFHVFDIVYGFSRHSHSFQGERFSAPRQAVNARCAHMSVTNDYSLAPPSISVPLCYRNRTWAAKIVLEFSFLSWKKWVWFWYFSPSLAPQHEQADTLPFQTNFPCKHRLHHASILLPQACTDIVRTHLRRY